MTTRLRVAVVQRVLAPYRVPVFEELARRPGLDVTFLYGRGTRRGQWQNARNLDGLRAIRLLTLSARVVLGARDYYVTWQPALLWKLWSGCYDVVLSEGTTNLVNDLFIVPFCRVMAIPLLLWDFGRDISQPMGPVRRISEPLIRLLLRSADGCIGYGNSSTGYLRSIGVPENSVFLARNTLDLDLLDRDVQEWRGKSEVLASLKSTLGFGERRVILHIGSLQKKKPLDTLISACDRLDRETTPVGLIVVGDGYDQGRLERVARDIGFRHIRFVGRRIADLAQYALISDVAVFPEGPTLAVIASLGYGLPVIAERSRYPEHEAIEHGRNGLLIEKGSLEDLTAALSAVLTGSIRLSSAEEIRAQVHRHYPLRGMVDGLERAIRSIVGRHRSGSEGAVPATLDDRS